MWQEVKQNRKEKQKKLQKNREGMQVNDFLLKTKLFVKREVIESNNTTLQKFEQKSLKWSKKIQTHPKSTHKNQCTSGKVYCKCNIDSRRKDFNFKSLDALEEIIQEEIDANK